MVDFPPRRSSGVCVWVEIEVLRLRLLLVRLLEPALELFKLCAQGFNLACSLLQPLDVLASAVPLLAIVLLGLGNRFRLRGLRFRHVIDIGGLGCFLRQSFAATLFKGVRFVSHHVLVDRPTGP
ncbi:hypothetical protein D3C71_1573340 [compost metagenome]